MNQATQDLQSRDLCKSCGFCCDGTFFNQVEIVEERKNQSEKYSKNKKLDVEVITTKRFSLPCSCFDQKTGCTIYLDRPNICKNFECGLLQQLNNGKRSFESSVNIVNQLRDGARYINDNVTSLASFIKPIPILRKFTLIYGHVSDNEAMQELGKLNSELLKSYMSFAMAYQQFFPKKNILPLVSKRNSNSQ